MKQQYKNLLLTSVFMLISVLTFAQEKKLDRRSIRNNKLTPFSVKPNEKNLELLSINRISKDEMESELKELNMNTLSDGKTSPREDKILNHANKFQNNTKK